MKINFFIFFFLFANFLCLSQKHYNLTNGKDIPLTLGGSILFGSSYHLESQMDSLTKNEITSLNPENINSFDKVSLNLYSEKDAFLSDVLLGINLTAPLLLFLNNESMNEFFEIGTMYYQTFVFNNSATLITKTLTKRIRPYAYNPHVNLNKKLNPDTRRSFFSGHTSNAFASAVFLAKVFSDLEIDQNLNIYIWAGSLSVATATGIFRITAGKHFPTDIIAGAIAGSLIGYIIPEVHKQNSKKDPRQVSTLFRLNFSL